MASSTPAAPSTASPLPTHGPTSSVVSSHRSTSLTAMPGGKQRKRGGGGGMTMQKGTSCGMKGPLPSPSALPSSTSISTDPGSRMPFPVLPPLPDTMCSFRKGFLPLLKTLAAAHSFTTNVYSIDVLFTLVQMDAHLSSEERRIFVHAYEDILSHLTVKVQSMRCMMLKSFLLFRLLRAMAQACRTLHQRLARQTARRWRQSTASKRKTKMDHKKQQPTHHHRNERRNRKEKVTEDDTLTAENAVVRSEEKVTQKKRKGSWKEQTRCSSSTSSSALSFLRSLPSSSSLDPIEEVRVERRDDGIKEKAQRHIAPFHSPSGDVGEASSPLVTQRRTSTPSVHHAPDRTATNRKEWMEETETCSSTIEEWPTRCGSPQFSSALSFSSPLKRSSSASPVGPTSPTRHTRRREGGGRAPRRTKMKRPPPAQEPVCPASALPPTPLPRLDAPEAEEGIRQIPTTKEKGGEEVVSPFSPVPAFSTHQHSFLSSPSGVSSFPRPITNGGGLGDAMRGPSQKKNTVGDASICSSGKREKDKRNEEEAMKDEEHAKEGNRDVGESEHGAQPHVQRKTEDHAEKRDFPSSSRECDKDHHRTMHGSGSWSSNSSSSRKGRGTDAHRSRPVRGGGTRRDSHSSPGTTQKARRGQYTVRKGRRNTADDAQKNTSEDHAVKKKKAKWREKKTTALPENDLTHLHVEEEESLYEKGRALSSSFTQEGEQERKRWKKQRSERDVKEHISMKLKREKKRRLRRIRAERIRAHKRVSSRHGNPEAKSPFHGTPSERPFSSCYGLTLGSSIVGKEVYPLVSPSSTFSLTSSSSSDVLCRTNGEREARKVLQRSSPTPPPGEKADHARVLQVFSEGLSWGLQDAKLLNQLFRPSYAFSRRSTQRRRRRGRRSAVKAPKMCQTHHDCHPTGGHGDWEDYIEQREDSLRRSSSSLIPLLSEAESIPSSKSTSPPLLGNAAPMEVKEERITRSQEWRNAFNRNYKKMKKKKNANSRTEWKTRTSPTASTASFSKTTVDTLRTSPSLHLSRSSTASMYDTHPEDVSQDSKGNKKVSRLTTKRNVKKRDSDKMEEEGVAKAEVASAIEEAVSWKPKSTLELSGEKLEKRQCPLRLPSCSHRHGKNGNRRKCRPSCTPAVEKDVLHTMFWMELPSTLAVLQEALLSETIFFMKEEKIKTLPPARRDGSSGEQVSTFPRPPRLCPTHPAMKNTNRSSPLSVPLPTVAHSCTFPFQKEPTTVARAREGKRRGCFSLKEKDESPCLGCTSDVFPDSCCSCRFPEEHTAPHSIRSPHARTESGTTYTTPSQNGEPDIAHVRSKKHRASSSSCSSSSTSVFSLSALEVEEEMESMISQWKPLLHELPPLPSYTELYEHLRIFLPSLPREGYTREWLRFQRVTPLIVQRCFRETFPIRHAEERCHAGDPYPHDVVKASQGSSRNLYDNQPSSLPTATTTSNREGVREAPPRTSLDERGVQRSAFHKAPLNRSADDHGEAVRCSSSSMWTTRQEAGERQEGTPSGRKGKRHGRIAYDLIRGEKKEHSNTAPLLAGVRGKEGERTEKAKEEDDDDDPFKGIPINPEDTSAEALLLAWWASEEVEEKSMARHLLHHKRQAVSHGPPTSAILRSLGCHVCAASPDPSLFLPLSSPVHGLVTKKEETKRSEEEEEHKARATVHRHEKEEDKRQTKESKEPAKEGKEKDDNDVSTTIRNIALYVLLESVLRRFEKDNAVREDKENHHTKEEAHGESAPSTSLPSTLPLKEGQGEDVAHHPTPSQHETSASTATAAAAGAGREDTVVVVLANSQVSPLTQHILQRCVKATSSSASNIEKEIGDREEEEETEGRPEEGEENVKDNAPSGTSSVYFASCEEGNIIEQRSPGVSNAEDGDGAVPPSSRFATNTKDERNEEEKAKHKKKRREVSRSHRSHQPKAAQGIPDEEHEEEEDDEVDVPWVSLLVDMEEQFTQLALEVWNGMTPLERLQQQLLGEVVLLTYRLVGTLIDWILPGCATTDRRNAFYYQSWLCNVYAHLHQLSLLPLFNKLEKPVFLSFAGPTTGKDASNTERRATSCAPGVGTENQTKMDQEREREKEEEEEKRKEEEKREKHRPPRAPLPSSLPVPVASLETSRRESLTQRASTSLSGARSSSSLSVRQTTSTRSAIGGVSTLSGTAPGGVVSMVSSTSSNTRVLYTSGSLHTIAGPSKTRKTSMTSGSIASPSFSVSLQEAPSLPSSSSPLIHLQRKPQERGTIGGGGRDGKMKEASPVSHHDGPLQHYPYSPPPCSSSSSGDSTSTTRLHPHEESARSGVGEEWKDHKKLPRQGEAKGEVTDKFRSSVKHWYKKDANTSLPTKIVHESTRGRMMHHVSRQTELQGEKIVGEEETTSSATLAEAVEGHPADTNRNSGDGEEGEAHPRTSRSRSRTRSGESTIHAMESTRTTPLMTAQHPLPTPSDMSIASSSVDCGCSTSTHDVSLSSPPNDVSSPLPSPCLGTTTPPPPPPPLHCTEEKSECDAEGQQKRFPIYGVGPSILPTTLPTALPTSLKTGRELFSAASSTTSYTDPSCGSSSVSLFFSPSSSSDHPKRMKPSVFQDSASSDRTPTPMFYSTPMPLVPFPSTTPSRVLNDTMMEPQASPHTEEAFTQHATSDPLSIWYREEAEGRGGEAFSTLALPASSILQGSTSSSSTAMGGREVSLTLHTPPPPTALPLAVPHSSVVALSQRPYHGTSSSPLSTAPTPSQSDLVDEDPVDRQLLMERTERGCSSREGSRRNNRLHSGRYAGSPQQKGTPEGYAQGGVVDATPTIAPAAQSFSVSCWCRSSSASSSSTPSPSRRSPSAPLTVRATSTSSLPIPPLSLPSPTPPPSSTSRHPHEVLPLCRAGGRNPPPRDIATSHGVTTTAVHTSAVSPSSCCASSSFCSTSSMVMGPPLALTHAPVGEEGAGMASHHDVHASGPPPTMAPPFLSPPSLLPQGGGERSPTRKRNPTCGTGDENKKVDAKPQEETYSYGKEDPHGMAAGFVGNGMEFVKDGRLPQTMDQPRPPLFVSDPPFARAPLVVASSCASSLSFSSCAEEKEDGVERGKSRTAVEPCTSPAYRLTSCTGPHAVEEGTHERAPVASSSLALHPGVNSRGEENTVEHTLPMVEREERKEKGDGKRAAPMGSENDPSSGSGAICASLEDDDILEMDNMIVPGSHFSSIFPSVFHWLWKLEENGKNEMDKENREGHSTPYHEDGNRKDTQSVIENKKEDIREEGGKQWRVEERLAIGIQEQSSIGKEKEGNGKDGGDEVSCSGEKRGAPPTRGGYARIECEGNVSATMEKGIPSSSLPAPQNPSSVLVTTRQRRPTVMISRLVTAAVRGLGQKVIRSLSLALVCHRERVVAPFSASPPFSSSCVSYPKRCSTDGTREEYLPEIPATSSSPFVSTRVSPSLSLLASFPCATSQATRGYPTVTCAGDVARMYVEVLQEAQLVLNPHDPLRAKHLLHTAQFLYSFTEEVAACPSFLLQCLQCQETFSEKEDDEEEEEPIEWGGDLSMGKREAGRDVSVDRADSSPLPITPSHASFPPPLPTAAPSLTHPWKTSYRCGSSDAVGVVLRFAVHLIHRYLEEVTEDRVVEAEYIWWTPPTPEVGQNRSPSLSSWIPESLSASSFVSSSSISTLSPFHLPLSSAEEKRRENTPVRKGTKKNDRPLTDKLPSASAFSVIDARGTRSGTMATSGGVTGRGGMSTGKSSAPRRGGRGSMAGRSPILSPSLDALPTAVLGKLEVEEQMEMSILTAPRTTEDILPAVHVSTTIPSWRDEEGKLEFLETVRMLDELHAIIHQKVNALRNA